MTDEKPKGLKPLNPETEEQYDDVINEIRAEYGIPLNRSLLSRIALEDYMAKRRKQNGTYDLKAVIGSYAKMKAEAEVKALESKLVAKRKAIAEFKA
jgi:hypothetical protein